MLNIQDWLIQMRSLIEKLQTLDLGYPQGENEIYPPDQELLRKITAESTLEPNYSLIEFYTYCNGIHLPDVYNGYFINRIEDILRHLTDGEPTHIMGYSPTQQLTNILVFGSDGGGGRFALNKDAPHEIVYMPNGAVFHSVFDGAATQCRVVNSHFHGFLKRLQSDVEAFIEGRDDWDYMID